MAKKYYVVFGTGNPSINSGLNPTFIQFFNELGQTLAPPGITEVLSGSGIYQFTYNATLSIPFTIDGGALLPTAERYITDALDPIQAVDEQIGQDAFTSFGSTSVDPTTISGRLKRIQEIQEGYQVVDKTAGTWDIYSRGQSTLLREFNLVDNSAQSTRT